MMLLLHRKSLGSQHEPTISMESPKNSQTVDDISSENFPKELDFSTSVQPFISRSPTVIDLNEIQC